MESLAEALAIALEDLAEALVESLAEALAQDLPVETLAEDLVEGHAVRLVEDLVEDLVVDRRAQATSRFCHRTRRHSMKEHSRPTGPRLVGDAATTSMLTAWCGCWRKPSPGETRTCALPSSTTCTPWLRANRKHMQMSLSRNSCV